MNESTADLEKDETIRKAEKVMLENSWSQAPKYWPTENLMKLDWLQT